MEWQTEALRCLDSLLVDQRAAVKEWDAVAEAAAIRQDEVRETLRRLILARQALLDLDPATRAPEVPL
jgi:hypothetical protein